MRLAMARGKLGSRVDFGGFGATLGSCAGVTGVPAVIVSLAVGDECRRCRVPGLPRPVVGVSPAAGDERRPYIRTAALPPAAGDECRRCRVPGLPRPVVGVPLAAGDKPQPYIRTVVGVSPAAGDERRPYIRTAALPPAAGDECRRCRVPGLPRPVVGVSPAAGDKPQPYRGRRCRRRRGMSAGVTLGRWLLFRWRLGMSAGRCRGRRCRRLSVFVRLFGNFEAHD